MVRFQPEGGVAMHRISGLAMYRLRNAFLASAATIAIAAAHAASAADFGPPMADKAPPPPQVYSWSGCYAGAQVGWGWGQSKFTDHPTHIYPEGTTYYGNVQGRIYQGSWGSWRALGSGLIGPGTLPAGTASVDQSGGLFGGQLGCNYQFTSNPSGPNFVLGVSGSAAGAAINGTAVDPYSYGWTSNYKAVSNNPTGLITANTDFLADISGRLGVTWQQLLFYGKGGVAWAHDQYTADTWSGVSFSPCGGPCYHVDISSAFSASDTVTGAVVGGGIEWAFARNWSAFAEYNHYFFPTRTLTFTAQGVDARKDDPEQFKAFVNVAQSIDTVKVGVNYRFVGW